MKQRGKIYRIYLGTVKMKIKVPSPIRLIATRPVIIITTLHENGKVNGGTFGAYTNLSPNLIGIAIGRPSDTYRNIKRTGELVINIPGVELAPWVFDVFGKDYPPGISEVEEAGLSTVTGEIVKVPLIKECKANIECRYVREMPVDYHVLVIVETLVGWCEQELIDEEGYFDVVKARIFHTPRYPHKVIITPEKYRKP